MKLTKEQVQKKYKGKYIAFSRFYDYDVKGYMYDIHKTSTTIRENMTLGEDVETPYEYCR